ncbi:MAG: RluA family pseudouridine synthase [Pseudomonadota bacterium]
MSGVEHRVVGEDEAEQRLDRWFRRAFPHVTQGVVEKLCRRGEIRVDGGRAKPATRIGPGQTVRVPPLPDADAAERNQAPTPAEATVSRTEADALQASVLWRDDAVLVINKPPGLSVQGGTGQARHLNAMLSALRFERDEDPRLIHRLDRDTSGVMVLARTGAAAASLGAAFRSRAVEKHYLAAVAGQPRPLAGTVHYALEKAGAHGSEKMRVVDPADRGSHPRAKMARTDYRVVAKAGGRASAVLLRPVTGRTHQLRAHMAAIGTPIVGDGKYGGRSRENRGDGWGASLGQGVSRKLHLHALRVAFPHPDGRTVTVAAPLPAHMARSWSFLDWSVDELPHEPFAAA